MSTIRRPTDDELAQLPGLEMRAGQRFAKIGMYDVSDAPPLNASYLRAAHDREDVWVTVEPAGPIAFAVLAAVDGDTYLDEISVHPTWGGKGVGHRLLTFIEGLAAERGAQRLVLSTFRDVPWNGPWYMRRGYVEFPVDEHGPELIAKANAEVLRGLDAESRVCLAKPLFCSVGPFNEFQAQLLEIGLTIDGMAGALSAAAYFPQRLSTAELKAARTAEQKRAREQARFAELVRSGLATHRTSMCAWAEQAIALEASPTYVRDWTAVLALWRDGTPLPEGTSSLAWLICMWGRARADGE